MPEANTNMELKNLITFIHVAELGSFTKAAEQHHKNKWISKSLKTFIEYVKEHEFSA